MDSDFEKKLERQKVRPLPAAWREEILRTANESALSGQASVRESVQPLPLRVALKLWLELFWPARRIWAGLAVAWAVIVFVNLDVARHSELASHDFTPPSPAVLMAWREEEWAFLGMSEPATTKAADRPKTVAPQPRSERSGSVASC